jgi:hypothetical protein
MVGQLGRPAEGNARTLEQVAALLMDAVEMLQQEIAKRKEGTGDGDDDTARDDQPGDEGQRGG